MKEYKILILSNLVGSGLEDDTLLAEAFEKDGHIVCVTSICYNEDKDKDFDVIIRRNTWTSSEEATNQLHIDNASLINRLLPKNIKTVNLVGLDGKGKGYLCDLFLNYENVLPTIDDICNLHLLPVASKYVIKDIKSFGNGLHQKFVNKNELETLYEHGNIIQPFMEFKSEVQCYYVGQKLMYVFEYTPSKFPDYPEPTLIELNEAEKLQADTFANYSNLKTGFQRIDFLRLNDDSLLLMEIEDHAAFMNLKRLPKDLLKEVLEEYTNNVYSFIEN